MCRERCKMKVLAILLVCAVAVQGRSTAVESVKSSKSLAALGDAPWLVHLRIAVSTSGLLQTGAGSLITDALVLTSAKAVQDARFIWVRYGVVNVINPSLVTETSAVTAQGDLALVNINRAIESTPNIAPVSLSSSLQPESAELYVFGANEDGGAGEQLKVLEVSLAYEGDSIIAQVVDGKLTQFDLGAPLVSEGKQIGVLIESKGDSGVFEKVSEDDESRFSA